MSAALVFALTVSAAAAPPPLFQDGEAMQLMRDACVGTELDRAAFERLGSERRWRTVRMTQRSGEPGWNVSFRKGDVTIMMLGDAESNGAESSSGVVCSVSVERVSPALEGQVSDLAASLGLGDEAPFLDQPPEMVPIRIWSRFGDKTLTYAAAPDGRAVISLSRQVVSILPTPASPPGN